ncbi:Gfo/Idh/MocA family oxidoreductase [Brevibacillus sp. FSL K6-0770]|jgi:predicted dehydrogenase|uniref:Gfo/Idh/MocA family protein n=1 Tax=Brevibacillus sp. FSL K6-0770 TaxID=2954673 RepID=UPI0030FB0011
MDTKQIRTGIIGGSLNNQWASKTHIPVLLQSERHRITAIATTNEASARKSAEVTGATLAATDHRAVSGSSAVELVVVSVKVPDHYDAVRSAILAGKHVYCEWPLAVTTSEAEQLAGLARQAGVHHAAGLQARQSPVLRQVKQRLERGEIGRILSCHMRVSTQGKGGVTDQQGAYLLSEKHGATLLAINGGHSLDALCYLLGDFRELSAMMNRNFSTATVLTTNEIIAKDTADQIMVQGVLKSGASAFVHIQAGTYPAFELEIQGELGVIRIVQHNSVGHVQFGNLEAHMTAYSSASRVAASNPDHFVSVAKDAAEGEAVRQYVASAHEAFAKDIQTGTFTVPDFFEALHLHRLLDAIRLAAATGSRQTF